jgi:hypothetical protein
LSRHRRCRSLADDEGIGTFERQKITMPPLRLHLDTSDYAAMYRAQAGTQEALVRDELIAMKESGRIEIGLSYHVVFELLQEADPKFRDDRLARARLLTQLCGQNAFPDPSDLGKGHGFSTEGLWVPRIYLDEIEIERLVRLAMEATTCRPEPHRRKRRALSKRRYFVEWVRNNSAEVRQLMGGEWPLLFGKDFATSGDLRRYILGEISRDEANKKLRFYITDPVTFYEIWYERYQRDNLVRTRRDGMADKIMVMLTELKAMIEEAAALKAKVDQVLTTSGDDEPNPATREKLSHLSL